MRFIVFNLFMLLSVFFTAAQQSSIPALGKWRDFFPLNNLIDVTLGNNCVYAASRYGIVKLDIQDNSLKRITRTAGLNDSYISAIGYEANKNVLLVGYENGNVDLVFENEIINLPDIKNANITADKKINRIQIYYNRAYLTTGLGIIVLDIDRKEIKDTYILGNNGTYLNVNQIDFINGEIFAATDYGIYSANENNPFLSSFLSWTKRTDLPAAVVNAKFKAIKKFDDKIFVIYDGPTYGSDTIFYYSMTNLNWNIFTPLVGFNNNHIETKNNKILFSTDYAIQEFDNNLNQTNNIFQYAFASIEASKAIFGYSNEIWIADKQSGLVKALNPYNNWTYKLNEPGSINAIRIDAQNESLLIGHASITGTNWQNNYNAEGVSFFDGNTWYNPNKNNSSLIIPDSSYDFLSTAIYPDINGKYYAGTLSNGGLFEFNLGQVTNRFDEVNSTIMPTTSIPGYCMITDIKFDKEFNLWIANAFVDEPLSVLKPNGQFKRFDCGPLAKNKLITRVLPTESGLVYLSYPNTGGLLVYNHNNTIDDISDDEYKFLSSGSGNGNLPNTDVKCVTEDLDKQIWIGTAAGIAVIYTPSAIFSGGNFDAQQIFIEQDGNIQILLENEVINCIAIDGANRKWIGTENSGVYLISDDGQSQIAHFTKFNSPLPSNQINDIAIHHKTGEVFFATEIGVVSYRGTATIEDKPFSEVYAFPNPVRPDYSGPIVIKGLDRDSDIKITDITGNIVTVIKSEGGQAVWDGKNMKGERVATGVYMVFANSQSGSQRAKTKILFIN